MEGYCVEFYDKCEISVIGLIFTEDLFSIVIVWHHCRMRNSPFYAGQGGQEPKILSSFHKVYLHSFSSEYGSGKHIIFLITSYFHRKTLSWY